MPSAGLGANLAILDGVHLCNLLVDMPSPTQENIAIVFDNYFNNRSKIAQAALDNARQFGKVMSNRVRFSSFVFVFASILCSYCALFPNASSFAFVLREQIGLCIGSGAQDLFQLHPRLDDALAKHPTIAVPSSTAFLASGT